jgi:hypothetical protein
VCGDGNAGKLMATGNGSGSSGSSGGSGSSVTTAIIKTTTTTATVAATAQLGGENADEGHSFQCE